MGASPWVLRTILYGLAIPWLSRPPPTRSAGYPMAAKEADWSLTEVQRWVAAGFVRRLSAAAGASAPWVSPTFVVYGGKPRLVVDLRKINRYITPKRFQYQRLQSFLTLLSLGDHLVSWDVSDAFYHIRILPEHRKFFRFVVGGTVYEPTVLPFGMRLSPWAWTKVLRPVVAALRRQGYIVNAYVDDFAAAVRGPRGSTAAAATSGRVKILDLFKSLGVHVHPTKGVAAATQRLPLLGFLVDTKRKVLLLPTERLAKVISMAKCILTAGTKTNRWVSGSALRRFTGTAVFCSLALPPARFFLRRLYDCQEGGRPGRCG